MFIVFLIWIGTLRMEDLRKYQNTLSTTTTIELSNQVSHFISERNRLVALFSKYNEKSITRLINNPNNEQYYEILANKVREFFPNYFSFTITNLSGKPYYLGMDGDIGEVCLNDIISFSKGSEYRPHIHPNYNQYHFDTMTRFDYGTVKGILFISFDADLLSQFIQASQAPKHQTILAKITDSILIEVVDVGARINIPREDYRLSDEERSRISSQSPIAHTQWHAVDMYSPELFLDLHKNILSQMLWVLLSFTIIILASLYFLTQAELRRKFAQQQKNDYLSMMNHELRTPLTAIRGSLVLISNGKLGEITDNVKKFVDISINSSGQLLNIINEMLDYDKLTSGAMKLTKDNEDLLSILEESIAEIESYAIKFNTKLNLIVNRKINFIINIDKQKIKQCLQNLISNAIKYGKENDNIEIKLEQTEHLFSIAVTDHGQGIPQEMHATLFDKYTTTNQQPKNTSSSTGLGLTIAKAFIELHNGKLIMESEEGVGSTFRIELPRDYK